MPVPSVQIDYKPITGFPGYRVGSDGSVWTKFTRVGVATNLGESLRIGPTWKKLKPSVARKGYLMAVLCHNKVRHRQTIHSLVLEAFVGPRPEGYVARHHNGVTSDNSVTNLSWSTQSENLSDRKIHGTEIIGERNGRAKLTVEQVLEVRRLWSTGRFTQLRLSRMFSVGQTAISDIVLRKKWQHV